MNKPWEPITSSESSPPDPWRCGALGGDAVEDEWCRWSAADRWCTILQDLTPDVGSFEDQRAVRDVLDALCRSVRAATGTSS
ncbi:hypothetical protein [Austwickia sp. TVS 96-490-7B]|uniref:hypothetical protein n=1 Tax=Austwickia sp. TVS 96-490-7B TaxID=2830843 RepID=UPI001C56D14E|nr:hypothetical protein [Austwickia sp. TVS 96-490-7B]